MSDLNADLSDLGQQTGPSPAEAEAREQGWVPQDEWTGPPDAWRDADTFIAKGQQVTAIMRKKLAGKDRELAELRKQLEGTSGTVSELRDYIATVEQKAFDRAVASLKAQRKDALSNGDFGGAAELEEQIDTLKEARSSVPEVKKSAPPPGDGNPPAADQVHPDVARWMQHNPWFVEANQDAVDFANGAALSLVKRYQAQGQQKPPAEILEEVTGKVRQRFPELFEAPAAMFDSSSSGGAGRQSSGRATGKGFNSLPADAKAQFQRFYDQNFYTVKGDKAKKLPLAEAQAEYFRNYE